MEAASSPMELRASHLNVMTDIFESPQFLGWLLGLFAAQAMLTLVCRRVPALQDLPMENAHGLVVLVPFVYLAAAGTRLWFFDAGFEAAFAEDKIYGYYAPAYGLVRVMLAFQLWDLAITVVATRLPTRAQALAHHASSALLAYMGLSCGTHGFCLYYAGFFFGASEISSIFLAFVDLFRQNPQLAKDCHSFNETVRVLFAVSFLSIRCIYWPFVCYSFWQNLLSSTAPLALKAVWMGFNVGLTCLQYYWGSLVVKGVIKLLQGGSDDKTQKLLKSDEES